MTKSGPLVDIPQGIVGVLAHQLCLGLDLETWDHRGHTSTVLHLFKFAHALPHLRFPLLMVRDLLSEKLPVVILSPRLSELGIGLDLVDAVLSSLLVDLILSEVLVVVHRLLFPLENLVVANIVDVVH